MKPKKLNFWLKILFSAILTVIIILVLGFFWLRQPPITATKEKIFKIFPYPLALVNGQAIYMKDFVSRYEILKKFYVADLSTNETKIKQDLFNEMVKEEKIDQLVRRNGLSVSNKQIDSEFKFRSSQNSNNFNTLLNNYGLNEKNYKDLVIKPDLETVNLTIWFNKQQQLNSEAFQNLRTVEEKLKSGQSMEELAANYSQDQSSSQIQGDLGFINSNELLPELLEQLDAMKIGDSKTIYSRYGIHIIKLEDKDNKGPENAQRLHLRQIFIQPADFETWFNLQTQNYKIQKLINI